MVNVLISGIGGDLGQSIAQILRKKNKDFKLVGVDANIEHGGKIFVDLFYKISHCRKKKYFIDIKKICKLEKIDIIVPSTEIEIFKFSNNLKLFKNTKILILDKKIIKIFRDKYTTYKYLRSINIPVPITETSFKKPLKIPCIFKPRIGSGSTNIRILRNSNDFIFKKNEQKGYIFQELLKPEDNEFTCCVYRSKIKKISIIIFKRKLVGGVTVWAKVYNHSKIKKICNLIAEKINLYGSLNIQLILTKQGPKIFEINPRFSSTVLIRHKLGFKDFEWQLNEALGKKINNNFKLKYKFAARVSSINVY